MAKLALLIGNDAYNDPRLARLLAPAADVHALQTVLTRRDIGRFDDVKVFVNTSLVTALREIGALFGNKHRNDLLLFYFSGHGMIDATRHLFLALNETLYDQPDGTAIDTSFIRRVMNKSRSRRQVLILDCCYSGAFEAGTKGAEAEAITEDTFEVHGYGREILTSSSATEIAYDSDQLAGERVNSLFTRFLVEGLRTGDAAPGCQEITVEQLYNYVHDRVTRETPGMTPQRWVDRQQGTLAIAKNPNPWGKLLPAQLRELLEDKNPLIREGAVRVLGTWLLEEDAGKQKAAEGKLTELRATEKHVDVRDAIDQVLRGAQREHERRAWEQARDREVSRSKERMEEAQQTSLTLRAEITEKDKTQAELARQMNALRKQMEAIQRELVSEKEKRQRAEEEKQRWEKQTQQLRARRVMLGTQAEHAQLKAGQDFRDRLKDGTQGPTMVVIPAGTFLMGSPKREQGRHTNEGPQHQVTIAEAFALGKYVVTFDEYGPFAQATQRKLPEDKGWGRGNRPVINVSWEDAVAYVEWLSAETGKAYRLPTEAEWEYAARAGTEMAYWWGNQLESNRTNCDGCGSQWDGKQTAPVGSFEPNPFGLYEMLGNVWEWVQDCWNDNYRGAPTDGTAWTASGNCHQRVVRGGSWGIKPGNVRSACRHWNTQDDRFSFVGFRLTLDFWTA